MKIFKLDPNKFPKVQRNIIITYAILALVGLGIMYLYLENNLFSRAWGLIPFVAVVFALAGWMAIRERKRYWDVFQLEVDSGVLTRSAYKTATIRIKKSTVTGVREVRQGLIVSTKTNKNMLLIPRQLADNDYQAIKRILETWVTMKE